MHAMDAQTQAVAFMHGPWAKGLAKGILARLNSLLIALHDTRLLELGSNAARSPSYGPREMVSTAVSPQANTAPTEDAGVTEGERAIILSITERARCAVFHELQ